MNDEQKERFRKYVEFYWERYKHLTDEAAMYEEPKEPIYELNDMEKINSQAQAMNVIRARMYVVASVDENGYFSMAASPVPHSTLAIAKVEARRLAKLSPGKMYVPMQLVGGEMLPKAVNFISV